MVPGLAPTRLARDVKGPARFPPQCKFARLTPPWKRIPGFLILIAMLTAKRINTLRALKRIITH